MNNDATTVVLSGWGISPSALARLFPAGTQIFEPSRENVLKIADFVARKNATRVVGYSLGSWLLLDAAARGIFSFENTTLYAPFLAFPREAGKGGNVSATQVKFLRRWLKKDPSAAIADFYARAGISLAPPVAGTLPYDADALDEGLRILLEEKLDGLPDSAKNWEIVLGEKDALLDAQTVAKTFSPARVNLIPAGTHDLLTLL